MMRYLLPVITVLLLTACGGPPPRVRTVPAERTGLVGSWRMVPYHHAGLERGAVHRQFAGLRTNDHLVLRLDGSFTAMPAADDDLNGKWLMRGQHLILRGFATAPRYAHPTTADWPIVRQEKNLFVVAVTPSLQVAFQRIVLQSQP